MGLRKGRRVLSIASATFIIFSALAVMNFTSMTVRADLTWNDNTNRTVSGTRWIQNEIINVEDGDLIITSTGKLILGNNVTLKIKCDTPGEYGIIIEAGGQFIVNSTNSDTEITYGSASPTNTYQFLNSGTINFLGTTVERVYGDPNDKTDTGGIRNLPGSSCMLKNCNIVDGDTHGIYIQGNSTNASLLDIKNLVINKTSNVLNGTGIWIEGNTDVKIDNVTVNGTKNGGFKVIGSSSVVVDNHTKIINSQGIGIYLLNSTNVIIEDGTEVRNGNTHGVYLSTSNATLNNTKILDNGGDGIVAINGSIPQIENSNISWNGGNGITVDNSTPKIKNNNPIQYNGGDGIKISNVWNHSANISGNIIDSNFANGLNLSNTDIRIDNNTISHNGLSLAFIDDMENRTNGWSSSGMWHMVNYQDGISPSWNITHSGEWSWWYGNDTTGNYDNGSRNYGWLNRTGIDLSGGKGATGATLTFWSYYETDGSTDIRRIIVNNDTVEWNLTLTNGPMNEWTRHVYNISAFTGSLVNITFFFDTMNNASNNHQGWYIDDVEIYTQDPVEIKYGINLQSETHCVIVNNRFNYNIGGGINGFNTTNVTISNNTFRGIALFTKSGGYNGIEITQCDNFNILNNAFNQTYFAIALRYSNGNNISYNSIYREGYGIYLMQSSDNNKIANNSVQNLIHCGICFFSGGSDNNTIIGNQLSHNRERGLLVKGSHNNITNNTIIDNAMQGIRLNTQAANNNTICGNNVGDNDDAGIQLFIGPHNNLIAHNRIAQNDIGIGVSGSANYNIFTNNTVQGNRIGINFDASGHNRFRDNEIINNSGPGFRLMNNNDNNSYINNTIYNNSGPGFYLNTNNVYNTLDNNSILECNIDGITLLPGNNHNIITSNAIENISGAGFGIRINNSHSQTIIGNKITNNYKGVWSYYSNDSIIVNNLISNCNGSGVELNNSNGVVIYYNNIINNTIQAIDDSTNNSWDNGYPSGGNYWSDYTGNDTYGGPGQNLSGSDGIGDSPYDITGGSNTDNYPMMYAERIQYNYWAKTYGGSSVEYPNYIRALTSDGGYILAGTTASFGAGSYDVQVIKLKSNGTIDWEKTYGYGNGYDEVAYCIKQVSSGGYILAGRTNAWGNNDVWLLRLNASGNITWQKRCTGPGNDLAYSVNETSDGHFIVAGFRTPSGRNDKEGWVLKFNGTSGGILWQKTLGGNSDDAFTTVAQASDGGYVLGGWTYSYGAGGCDFWIVKLYSNGTVNWQKTYGNTSNEKPYTPIIQTSDGGYILGGYTDSVGAGGWDMWLVKVNSTGTVSWEKTYGGANDDYANGIQRTSDGGYVVAGVTASDGAGSYDCWVLKISASGSITWQMAYGGVNEDYANTVDVNSQGGIIVGGYTNSFGNSSYDHWILKLGAGGEMVFAYGSGANATKTKVSASVTTCTVRSWNSNYTASGALVGNTIATVQASSSTVETQSAAYDYCWIEDIP